MRCKSASPSSAPWPSRWSCCVRRRYWAALRNSVNKILSTDGMTQNLTLQRPLVGSDGTVTVVLLSLFFSFAFYFFPLCKSACSNGFPRLNMACVDPFISVLSYTTAAIRLFSRRCVGVCISAGYCLLVIKPQLPRSPQSSRHCKVSASANDG